MRAGLRGLLLACLIAAPALAEPRGTVRTGTEGERGRVVFDWTERVPHRAERDGERVRIRFGDGVLPDLAGARRLPRNVASVAAEGDAVVVTIVAGARTRVFVLGNRVVLDALDAPASAGGSRPATVEASATGRQAEPRRGRRAASPSTSPETAALAAALAGAAQTAATPTPPEEPPRAASPAQQPVATAEPSGEPPAASAPPVAAERGDAAPSTPQPPPSALTPPAALAPSLPVRRAPAEAAPLARIVAGLAGPALLLGASGETGAAVLRRNGDILVLLDGGGVPDLVPLRTDPTFGAASATPFPGGVLLRLPIAPPAGLASRRVPEGWLFEVERGGPSPPARTIAAAIEVDPAPRIVLRAARPGRVLAIPDPDSGAPLLIATLREAGQAMTLPRALPEARLLPTMLGVAVLARSDHLGLRVLPDRILLQGSPQAPLVLGPASGTAMPLDASTLRRVLDLPPSDRTTLLDRLRSHQADITAAAPLARSAARRDAAEAMLALGLAQEAQAMAALALREDPRAREDGRLLLLHGAAATAAHRPSEAGTLDDARLPDGEEASLWRALRRVAQGDAAEAGAAVSTALPLLLAYPADLRARLLPMAMEALIESGETDALRHLVEQGPETPALAFAQARQAEAEGRAEDALAGYAALAVGRDRLTGARARRRSVELRLASGMIELPGAADALDATLFAWRGDGEELRTRLRVAELRHAAGMPRAAFAVLEETARLFPDQAGALRAPMEDALLEAIATEPPLAAATPHQAHGGMLTGVAAERAARLLADRLVALDLADQAARLLRDAIARASDGAGRASLGTRLAALRLGEGDAAGALDALEASEATELTPPLAEERRLLAARALAMRGEAERAVAILDSLGPAGAASLAELRAAQRDWDGAAAALARHLEAVLPAAPAPIPDDRQREVTQLAAYLALAGDTQALDALRARYALRMGEGPLAESFALLTGDAMRGMADLPRLARELEMLRLLPARLEALRSGGGLTR